MTLSEENIYQWLASELPLFEEQMANKRCVQVIDEKLDEGSFLWQSLSHLYQKSQLTEQMLSSPLSEPHILLAAFLSTLERSMSPDNSLFRSLFAIAEDNTLRFCISGEVSVDDLKKALEYQKDHSHFPDKK